MDISCDGTKHFYKTEKLPITNFPWGRPDIYPVSYGEIALTDKGLSVYMFSEESEIRATVTDANGPVYQDSCLEFFFSPCPEKTLAYFNFEVNSLGTLYVGYSPDGTRDASAPINWERFKKSINIQANVADTKDFWSVSYTVPYELIREYQPDFHPETYGFILGNMYKCGDNTKYPHFAVWNPIDTSDIQEPDFHVAKYFSKMKFVTKNGKI